jgi:hypothetical protein
MILGVLAILLLALGHLVRDGSPPLGKTQVARYAGLVLCVMGAALAIGRVSPTWALVAGLCVGIGYWLDQRHGEGQGADDWEDARDLAISGATSLALLIGFMGWFAGEWAGVALLLVGLLGKPALAFGAWCVVPARLYPTRWFAGAFGAAIGAVLVILGG